MLKQEISIQTDDFSLADEVALLEKDNVTDGAVVTFTGRVRNNNNGNSVTTLTLEHYPGMTEKSLAKIIIQAKERWNIGRVKVIHRIGELSIGDQIVFVGVTSKHRQDAFAANEFIMDYLKVKAPFWKKEQITDDGQTSENWLDAKNSDSDKADLWS
ncbi:MULTISPECIES: molybdopterin synthase catalytic subunit MoaE [Colwellia]|jgi:molybdopterin synthase catalytic subunit|uniref:Molybdopterin synthase catalytic subunit n=1 Tax=Colwellia psychrerythraea (strain 34H / ATCC BAA-681) TaxID=167879 RepID=Q47V87_COLP3|nr:MULTISPECIES: molybdopterin synthase catalytic subunit MoaE [Colwellia]AAZ24526.1 molybdopterin converting factor, subunit 2 [Colwellia psychrerythraea 34H]PKH85760.1 molybdopterin synthase catalytic subunit MoaE [Colwellia sp. Bg11-28]